MQKDIAIPITMSFLHNCPILTDSLQTTPRMAANTSPKTSGGGFRLFRFPRLPAPHSTP